MRKIIGFILIIVVLTTNACITGESKIESSGISSFGRVDDFNFGWKFSTVSDSSSIEESGIEFLDSSWKDIRLPHDWSVAFSYDSVKGDGATAFLLGGTGWYRKHFDKKVNPDEKVCVLFDGVYNNSEVWINGQKLGMHPYGYTPFYYDITKFLNKDGQSNIIAVKVDHTRYIDSRWYTGSGIYRNVKLVTSNKLHIPIWGTFVTTPLVTESEAKVNLAISVKNDFSEDQKFELHTQIYGPAGNEVAVEKSQLTIVKETESSFDQSITLTNPLLWDIENPNMYKAITSVFKEEKLIDQYETPFGIRSIRFDKDTGFYLNDKNMKIKGVCLHHDGGLVGTAVPKGVWRRRFAKLKEGGVNAIRISHNPGSQEFLDLCDEMGILVQDEFFDEWDNPKDKRLNKWETKVDYVTRGYGEHFQEWAERDLKVTIQAHRNHPSIFQWSIGNEIEWTYPRYSNATGFFNMDWKGNYFWELPPIPPTQIKQRYSESPEGEYILAKTAKKLAQWTKEMDTSRPVVANQILPSASYVTGYTDALDVVGFSYRRILYDYGHENYPDKPLMGTENLGQWHEWKAVMERPHVSGMFIWTGIDYMGESHNNWPRKALPSGLIDISGFDKGSWHMMKTLWVDEPHIHIATQNIEKSINKIDPDTGLLVAKDPNLWKNALWIWQDVNNHWNYENEEMISIEIYSNCDEVELFLNEKSLGTRKLAEFEDHIYKWAVPYSTGALRAEGKLNGKTTSAELISAGEPTSIKLTIDKTTLDADGYDVAHVVAQLVDADENPVKTTNHTIHFDLSGDARVLGVDNGSPRNVQDHQTNKITTHQGRALLIVQSNRNEAEVKITAKSAKLKEAEVKLAIQKNTHP